MLRNRLGWTVLLLLCLVVLVLTRVAPVSARPGLTEKREFLIMMSVLVLAGFGFWFRWGAIVFWPSIAVFVASNCVVNGLSASHHTALFALIGLFVGLAVDLIRRRSSNETVRDARA